MVQKICKKITGQSDAVSEVMLEKIRRGEKIPNLPKGLESYQDVCSRLRGIGHACSDSSGGEHSMENVIQ